MTASMRTTRAIPCSAGDYYYYYFTKTVCWRSI
ncbi:hypothetical protein CGRA01v4_07404 [Colletotrichum graminicola]|nr:hypothetical protein CGRA01v4_07404 [Colletotrichum graminicola]